MPLPQTPLESSLSSLVISDCSTLPQSAYAKGTKEGSKVGAQVVDEFSSSNSDDHDYVYPDYEFLPQKESPSYPHATNMATHKDIQEDDEGCIIIQKDFRSPVTKEKSLYLEIIATGDKTVNDNYAMTQNTI